MEGRDAPGGVWSVVYFLDALKVLRRRWLAVVIGLLLTLAGGGAVLKFVPTDHQASAQLLLILPPEFNGPDKPPVNPYLNLLPGLNSTASLISGTLTTDEAQKAMAKQGFRAEYTITLLPDTGPLLLIQATDPNPAIALKTRDELIKRLDTELGRIQVEESVPTAQVIHARTDAVSADADPQYGGKIRSLVVVLVAGLLLTIFVVFLREGPRSRRRNLDEDALGSDGLAPLPPDAAAPRARRQVAPPAARRRTPTRRGSDAPTVHRPDGSRSSRSRTAPPEPSTNEPDTDPVASLSR